MRLPLESVDKSMSGKESRKKVFNVVPSPTFPMIRGSLKFEMNEDMGAEPCLFC